MSVSTQPQSELRGGAGAPPGPRALEVRPLRAADDAARDALVRGHPRGTPFHLAGWGRAVERVFRHPRQDLGAFAREGAQERLLGILPLARCATPFGPPNLVSVPYGVYGGPLGADVEVERALVAAACELAEERRVGRLELRCVEPPPEPAGRELVAHELYATFVNAVPSDPEEVLKRMPKRGRAEVRKARERFGLELSAGPWFLDDLVRLFHESKRSLGSPGLPRRWFAALMEELEPAPELHLVRAAGGAVAAATMSFVLGGTFSLYYIGTSDEGNRTFRATNWLVAELQEECARRGLAHFDLGRSRVDSGPYSFKKHQGFEPTPLAYRLLLVRSRSKPSFNPSNPRTKVLRDTWSRMPSGLARALSGPLSRFLY